ncbi:uncharacterized protein [Miscanthus floridulus]|uniref:uncharacterized protein n=1 Tax=Miscanthus floridulus TaxID=154761 RepID=UPI00345898BB
MSCRRARWKTLAPVIVIESKLFANALPVRDRLFRTDVLAWDWTGARRLASLALLSAIGPSACGLLPLAPLLRLGPFLVRSSSPSPSLTLPRGPFLLPSAILVQREQVTAAERLCSSAAASAWMLMSTGAHLPLGCAISGFPRLLPRCSLFLSLCIVVTQPVAVCLLRVLMELAKFIRESVVPWSQPYRLFS